MIDDLIGMLAGRLHDAAESGVSIEAISAAYPGLSLEDAYRVQMRNVQRALSSGAKISGKKIGLTSAAMQRMLGVDEPDYGHLFDTMDMADGRVPAGKLLQPKVEGEIAFVLKKDLKGPGVTVQDVLEATDYVVPALEIVDSRIRDWKIKLVDTVADNASSGCYVLGGRRFAPDSVDLEAEAMTLYKNGGEVNKGTGRDVMGGPAYCVAWLANKLGAYGVTLGKGEVVLSGALSAAADARPGDVFEARFAVMGSVRAEFIG